MPNVQHTDAYWHTKTGHEVTAAAPAAITDLHVPRNSPVGVFLAFFAVILGFALIWRIDWLAGIGLIGAVAVILREAWKTDLEVRVPSEEVATFERAHPAAASAGDRP
jgi:cytochrome o ubiquinol oxidase subunit 1